MANPNCLARLLGHNQVEQKVLEYFDYRYWQAIKAGDIKEASRIKAEWDKTEQTILNKTQTGLDAAGVIDPTPISDGTNAIISILRENYIEAGLSAVSILPIAGDIIGKGGKLGLKYGDEVVKNISTNKFKPTIHSIEQKINRRVRTADEIDAIKNPLKVTDVKVDKLGRPSQQMIGKKATVAVNHETKKVISVWQTSTKKAAKLKKQ